MTATCRFSTKRARRSRLAEPPEGPLGLPRFLGKTAGVAALFSCGFAVRFVLYIYIGGRRAFRNVERFQKLLGRQNRAAGPARRVLDLPVGGDDDRSASQLARQPHELVVGRQGRAREDHADATGLRGTGGDPRAVEDHRAPVLERAASPREQAQARPPSSLEPLGLTRP